MHHQPKIIMGMFLEEWKHKTCTAHIAEFIDSATLYDIESKEQGKGHAFELLSFAKKYYKKQGKELRGSVALNKRMSALYRRVGIKEYKD